jgi:uncharacterized membrane protein YphA (DoxX/SURF4 family)
LRLCVKKVEEKTMNIFLWILQILLGFMFIMHSYVLLTKHQDPQTLERMAYVGDLSAGLRTFIAISELLGGVGLILPALTGILPELTAWAGVGIVLIMALAAIFHFQRGEYSGIVFNLILLALAAFVAYGRFALEPF